MRRISAALILLAACHPRVQVDDIVTEVVLSRIQSCDELESHLEERAVDSLDAEIEARLEKGFYVPPVEAEIRSPEIVGSANFSPIVSSGELVLVLHGGAIRSVRADPLQEIASAPIEGDPIGIVPAGDRIFVLTRTNGRTRVTLLAREDLSTIRSLELAGSPQAALAGSDGLTLVLSGGLLPPPTVSEDPALLEESSFRYDREGEIRDRTLDHWFESDDLERDCTAFYYVANAPLELDLTRIVQLDAVDLHADARALLGRTEVTAAADGTILLALPHRWRLPRPGQTEHSYLLAFTESGEQIASGGVDGIPHARAIQISGGAIRMITVIDRRESDPINTWGRVARAHRVELLELADGVVVSRSASPLFAHDQLLRTASLFEARAVAATSDRIYAFDLDRPDAFAAFPLDRPVDRLVESRGALIATSTRDAQLELALLDPASLDRVLSSRLVSNLLPGAELAISVDPSGLIAVPEIGAPPPDSTAPVSVSVRVLSVKEASLSSTASIELSLLHAQRTEPPHLVYGMFVAGRALAVSDAGAAALGDTESPAIQSIRFQ